MNTTGFKFLIFSCLSLLLLIQCKTTQDSTATTTVATTSDLTEMNVRILLGEGQLGKYIQAAYSQYQPTKVKPASRSENWYRVKFTNPGDHDELMAKFEADENIIKVEMESSKGTKIQSGKSQKEPRLLLVRRNKIIN